MLPLIVLPLKTPATGVVFAVPSNVPGGGVWGRVQGGGGGRVCL